MADAGVLELQEGTEPSSPSATFSKVYVDEADGMLKKKDSSGAVVSMSAPSNTDGLSEGVTNKYFTDERAQDAVGSILGDTATIEFTYDDAGAGITADVIAGSIGDTQVATGINASKISGGLVNNTKFDHLQNVSSDIQTQINSKQATLTGAASTVVSSDLGADKAVVTNGSGKITDSTTTAAEIGHLGGVTSSIQAQINAKAASVHTHVVADVTDFAAGFSTQFATKDTDDLAEGANLYHTTARARSAVVDNAIVNAVTDKAPSQNAVFDALENKVAKTGDSMDGPLDMIGDLLGTGHIILRPQDNAPSVPASGIALHSNTDERLAWISQNGYVSSFDVSAQSDNRVYGLPDLDGPLMADPMVAIGDLIYRDPGNVTARLGIGATDDILRVSGGIPQWTAENLTQDIGDGSDGNLTLSGALTAPDILYYDTLTLDTLAALNPDAYIIYAKTLDLTNAPAGAISRNGNNGALSSSNSSAAGGAAFTARVLATSSAGGAGAAGQTNNGVQGAAGGAVTIGNGGNGGASGTSGAGGSGIAAVAISGGAVATSIHFGRFEYQFLRGAVQVSGGAGGRGGNAGGGDGANSSRGGGGGGAGGAVLVLYVGEIITSASTPAGVITAKGGMGGRQNNPPAAGNVGGAGGAGGGGGGYVYIAYVTKTGPVVTNLIDASGGNGGDGSNGLGTGIGGNGGAGGNGGRIQLFNVTTGLGTLTTGAAGSAGTAGSGVTGGVGGQGGSCKVSL